MSANYSSVEIEEKRLSALRRKAEKESKICANGGRRDSNEGNSEVRRNTAANPDATFHKFDRRIGASGSPGAIRRKKSYSDRPSPIAPQTFFGARRTVEGTCAMCEESRFAVDVEYDKNLIDTFKTIPSKLYDQKTRQWSFHINDYEKLITSCSQLKPRVQITGIPRYVLEVFRENLKKRPDSKGIDLSRIDKKLTDSLMPFQREGVCYGISKTGRCFIADDMGLGKTIQALGIAHYYSENWPLLIVTPSSVRYQWSEAIFTFLPSIPTQYVHHFTSGKDVLGNAKVTIVTYDLLVKSIDLFLQQIFGFVILDESHTVKSGKAARTRAVKAIASQARHLVLLSGTPALSRPVELHSQMSLIAPTFMKYHDYGVRYCAGVMKNFGWDFSGSSNMQELLLLIRACGLIRRLKTDVLQQLPAKVRQIIILDDSLIKKPSKEAKALAATLNKLGMRRSEKKRTILKYYHESSDQRVLAVCNYVTTLLEKEQKFLIYAHHQVVLEAISDLLTSKNIRFIRIDGKTLPEQRKCQVDEFQSSDSCLVAILSITAANAGITLTAAQLVVFAELFWNPGILCQAEDRVHRIGQGNSVCIQYLVAPGTADDYLWPMIQQKIDVLMKVGLEQDFCLDKADVSEQVVDDEASTIKNDQRKMDQFLVKTSPGSSKQENVPSAAVENVPKSKEDFNHLLDLDENDFADIDLDEFP